MAFAIAPFFPHEVETADFLNIIKSVVVGEVGAGNLKRGMLVLLIGTKMYRVSTKQKLQFSYLLCQHWREDEKAEEESVSCHGALR